MQPQEEMKPTRKNGQKSTAHCLVWVTISTQNYTEMFSTHVKPFFFKKKKQKYKVTRLLRPFTFLQNLNKTTDDLQKCCLGIGLKPIIVIDSSREPDPVNEATSAPQRAESHLSQNTTGCLLFGNPKVPSNTFTNKINIINFDLK